MLTPVQWLPRQVTFPRRNMLLLRLVGALQVGALDFTTRRDAFLTLADADRVERTGAVVEGFITLPKGGDYKMRARLTDYGMWCIRYMYRCMRRPPSSVCCTTRAVNKTNCQHALVSCSTADVRWQSEYVDDSVGWLATRKFESERSNRECQTVLEDSIWVSQTGAGCGVPVRLLDVSSALGKWR